MIISNLKGSIGCTAEVFMRSNGFRYEGKIIGCDDEFLIILDFKKNYNKYIELADLKEANVYNG